MRRGRMFGPLVSWYVIAVLSQTHAQQALQPQIITVTVWDESCSGTADDGYVVD